MSEYTLHKFRPSETIDAVMRLKGGHSYTQAEMIGLRKRFNELNGAVVPRPGDIYKIPLEGIITDDFGTSVVRPVDVPVVSGPGSDGEKPADHKESTDPHHQVEEFKALPVPSPQPEQKTEQSGNKHVPPRLRDKYAKNIK